MNEPATLKSLRDRPFELLAELERRGRAVTAAAASENPGAREWVGVAFRMAGELYLAAREETREVLAVPPGLTRVPGAKPWVKGIAVNLNGDRFVNEEIYCGFLGDAIARQPDATAWLILDCKGFWRVVRECLNFDRALFKIYLLPTLLNLMFGGTKKARTLAKLAAKLDLPSDRLEAAVAANNVAAAGKAPDAFSKSRDNLEPIGRGPYYAINLSTANRYSFTQLFTLGGLRVDETTGHVVREDGSRIDGLYAAGRAAVGLCSIGYVSGMAIADAVFSGRRAGRSVGTQVQCSALGVTR